MAETEEEMRARLGKRNERNGARRRAETSSEAKACLEKRKMFWHKE